MSLLCSLGFINHNSTFVHPKQGANFIAAFFELTTVRAFAPSFGPVLTPSVSKKMRQQIFIKVREITNLGGAKAAAPPRGGGESFGVNEVAKPDWNRCNGNDIF
jgi:hypothetical protein